MSKRSYTHIKLIKTEIIAMREAGKSRREIAEHFGLETEQIKWWISRYNRRKKKLETGIVPRPKGRPRKDGEDPHQQEKTELERLRMENKLFLQPPAHSAKNWRGAAHAAPLRLKLNIFLPGAFFVLSV